MKTYAEIGGHAGDLVKVRGTKRVGTVQWFEPALLGIWTYVDYGDGAKLKYRTVDLVLVKKGPGWNEKTSK